MSQGSGEKTEKPTPKRIQDAREQGQVAKSQDFNGAIVLTAATGAMAFVGPYTFANLYTMMQNTFGVQLASKLATKPLTVSGFNGILSDAVQSMTWLLMPFLLTILVLALLSNLIQVKPLFAAKAIMPKLDKINPLNGFKRMFSMRAFVEVGKAIAKMVIIGGCGALIINEHLSEVMVLGMVDVPVAWGTVLGILAKIAMWCCVLFFVMGLIDWRYQAYEMEKQLRMSRQDIKDERKNQEGDPMMKQRIRQLGIQMSKNRQLASVPTADVVITNPTHFAIAIKYDPDVAPAPVVIAKGQDHFALKIKEVAKENNITVIENKPLARALYAACEVDAMIPPDLFIAVAEVLAYVFAKNKGRKLQGNRSNAKKSSPQAMTPQGGNR